MHRRSFNPPVKGSKEKMSKQEVPKGFLPFMGGSIFIVLCLICLVMWGCPVYSVWQQEQTGKA